MSSGTVTILLKSTAKGQIGENSTDLLFFITIPNKKKQRDRPNTSCNYRANTIKILLPKLNLLASFTWQKIITSSIFIKNEIQVRSCAGFALRGRKRCEPRKF